MKFLNSLYNREKEIIIILLFIIFNILLFANLFKYNIISLDKIEKLKDIISTISTIITTSIIIVGASISYIKFFKGNLLGRKLEGNIDVSIHPKSNIIMHSIKLFLKNAGNVKIYHPLVNLEVIKYYDDKEENEKYDDWGKWRSAETRDRVRLIDTQETIVFFGKIYVPKNVAVVTYIFEVFSENRDIWVFSHTINNKVV